MIRAVILAAGRGSRMRELTEVQPKCMTVLHGKPLIQHQIASLQQAGVQEVAVVCGYRAEQLVASGISQRFLNPQWATTNMVSSLLCASEWLEEGLCLISYSDIFYEAQAPKSLVAEISDDIAITYDVNFQALWSQRLATPLDDLETFKLSNGLITEIGLKPQSFDDIQGQYMGLLKMTPVAWRAVMKILQTFSVERIAKLDMTTLLNTLIKAGVVIRGIPFQGIWGEVDTASDLQVYANDRRFQW